jgi:hypothetical protein
MYRAAGFSKSLILGAALMPIATVLMSVAVAGRSAVRPADDQTAKELKDVSDASKSTDPKSGSKYANCTFYQGSAGSAQGGARKFPARQ